MVVPEVLEPILGMPALTALELVVDPIDHTIHDKYSRQIVYCSWFQEPITKNEDSR